MRLPSSLVLTALVLPALAAAKVGKTKLSPEGLETSEMGLGGLHFAELDGACMCVGWGLYCGLIDLPSGGWGSVCLTCCCCCCWRLFTHTYASTSVLPKPHPSIHPCMQTYTHRPGVAQQALECGRGQRHHPAWCVRGTDSFVDRAFFE